MRKGELQRLKIDFEEKIDRLEKLENQIDIHIIPMVFGIIENP